MTISHLGSTAKLVVVGKTEWPVPMEAAKQKRETRNMTGNGMDTTYKTGNNVSGTGI